MQIFGYAGTFYAPSSLISAMMNLIPGITFLFAVLFRFAVLRPFRHLVGVDRQLKIFHLNKIGMGGSGWKQWTAEASAHWPNPLGLL